VEKKQAEYGSDVVVDLMKAFDIEYAAFNPGASFRGIQDSIVNYGGNYKPEVIFCFHEEISVALAHGYAKAKGKPMAAIVHNIVGLQHATMAIFNAWCDRVPVMVLGGTGPMDATLRRPWIDWIHTALVQGNQVRDYVKWDDQPATIASIPESFIRGYRLATTEPAAPVYINYDAGLQEQGISQAIEIPDIGRFSRPSPLQADPEALLRAAKVLVDAQSPLIIADFLGRNPKAVGSLVELAELLAVPVLDKGNRHNISNRHPLDVTGGAADLMKNADVILALDVQDLYGSLTSVNRTTRVIEPVTKPSVKIIHISLNELLVHGWATDCQPLQAVDVPINADTSLAVPELTRLCRQLMEGGKKKSSDIEARFNTIKALHDRLYSKWLDEARATITRQEISTACLAYELGEVIKEEDWILVNGNANGWARRLWSWTKPNQYLGRSGGAGLGYGMGAAIGGALAHLGSGAICVNIQADGDLLMTSSALWTAAKHRIPLLTVMHNNQSFYNSEEHQYNVAEFRKRPVETAGIGTHVDDPTVDFAKMAESFGVHAEGPIVKVADLRPALRRALKVVKEKKLPALVDVISEAR
jgi:thiamine pyrophosphate-dependent acetolactate synthase large subunit-like protein